MVRQRTLTPPIKVRILVPQPNNIKHLGSIDARCLLLFRGFVPLLYRSSYFYTDSPKSFFLLHLPHTASLV
jgi:hypothetical protein